jgi:integrating conjugative element protein (TIGR03757 family)
MPILSSQLFSVLFLSVFSLPVSAEVLVVTDTGHPVKVMNDERVIELDLPARIEAELSADLPADPERAADMARERLRDPTAQRRLFAAYQGVAEARGLNVAKVPAVIVDRRCVIYGEADVARAVARLDACRSARP